VPGQPIGVVYAQGSAWVTSFERNAVVRIDRATNRVVAEVPVGVGPVGVTAAAGSVWVADRRRGTVTRVDPTADRAIATIPVGGPGGPFGLVVNAGAGTVSRVAAG
jgi:YVTN family beta-propeller protein